MAEKMDEKTLERLVALGLKAEKRIEKEKAYNVRYSMKLVILREKAAKAGIAVTEAEIDARLKKEGK